MDYWNDTLTEKSWKILQDFKGHDFILIGGWAAYLWTRLHKSKDIDIALKRIEDLERLKQGFDLRKNANLRKYEIKVEEIDVDIYVPFFSRLSIPVERLGDYTSRIQGFEVVRPEALLILKQGAEEEREHSVKGEKDRIDIVTILSAGVDLLSYRRLLHEHSLERYRERLQSIVAGFSEHKYLNMTPRELKLKKRELLAKLRQA